MSLKQNIFILTFCVFLKCVIADRNQDKTDFAAVNPIVLHTSISKDSPFNGLSIISRNSHTSYEERQRPEQLLSVQQSNFWPAKTSNLFFEERYQPETRIEQKFPINIEEYNEKNSHDRYQHLGNLQLYNILPSYENSKFSAELLTDGDLLHYRSQPSNRKPRVPPSSRSFSYNRDPPPPNRKWSPDKISYLETEPYSEINPLASQGPLSNRGSLAGSGLPPDLGPPSDRGPPPGRGPPLDRGTPPGYGPQRDCDSAPGYGPPPGRGPSPGQGRPPGQGPPPGRNPPPDQGPPPSQGLPPGGRPPTVRSPPPDRGPPPRSLTSWDEYPTRDALIDREQQHQQQKYYSYITSEPQNSPSSVSPLPNINPSSNTNNNNNFNHTEETVSSLYKSGMKKTSNSSRKNYQVLFQAQPVVPEE